MGSFLFRFSSRLGKNLQQTNVAIQVQCKQYNANPKGTNLFTLRNYTCDINQPGGARSMSWLVFFEVLH